MNIVDLHIADKGVSAISIFKTEGSSTMAIQILKDEKLKEHTTKVPALLICIKGKAVFETENGNRETLMPGDYLAIEPFVKHWVEAISDCQLVLIK